MVYFTPCGDSCGNITADASMHNAETRGNTVQYLASVHDSVDSQLRRWQDGKRFSGGAGAAPQQNFTQVTVPAYERRESRHGTSCMTHRCSNTQRLSGDLVRSPACDGPKKQKAQYNNVRKYYYYEPDDQTDVANETQCAAPMLLNAYPYPSGAYRHPPYYAACQAADQTLALDYSRAASSPVDCFSPYAPVGLPPTPADTVKADTVKADEVARKNSSMKDVSPVYSPQTCEKEMNSYGTASAINAVSSNATGDSIGLQQEIKSFLTPPPEQAEGCPEQVAQPCNGQAQDTNKDIETKSDWDAGFRQKDASNIDSSPVPVMGDDPDLNFLSSDWDPNNFDFLNRVSGFAPASMSEQADSWDTRHDDLPQTYPVLGLDPGFLAESGARFHTFQSHSGFAPDTPLEYPFDQYGRCQPPKGSSTVLQPFQASYPPFETHTYHTQPSLVSQANDRTSHRSKNKDQMLVDLKQRGYSYKDIKVMGQFEEAESTLRGRYRTLTKPKEARVRKPEWGDREIALLLQAVAAHTNAANDHASFTARSTSTMSRRAAKIPWKQVAEYMALRGAYRYGNATVKKKWTEVMAARVAQ